MIKKFNDISKENKKNYLKFLMNKAEEAAIKSKDAKINNMIKKRTKY